MSQSTVSDLSFVFAFLWLMTISVRKQSTVPFLSVYVMNSFSSRKVSNYNSATTWKVSF